MSQVKVFEIEPYVEPKTKIVSRRFVDQFAYCRQKDYWGYNKPIIAASHILREDGKWEIWNGNGWSETIEPIIVKTTKELIK